LENAATLALGTVAVEPGRLADGGVHIWLDLGVLAMLKALRGPGEIYSDVILRLSAGAEGRIVPPGGWASRADTPGGFALAPGFRAFSKRCEAGASMATPTDGEWMSAKEALEFLISLKVNYMDAVRTICTRAHAGLIKARANVFIGDGKRQSDVEVPPEFWWARGDAGLTQNWDVGDFETMASDFGGVLRAFGVTFRRSDIEQLKPANVANPSAPLSPAQRPAGRTVFIGHGGHSSEWLKLEKFLSHRLHLSPVEFNSTSVAGVATTDRLMEMLGRADFAFLILTGEDEQGTGEFHPRLNVHGLTDIRFPKGKIEAAFEEVRGVLEREGLI
jgi:Predicted nucleotide-binding protein containing TIR-like domain